MAARDGAGRRFDLQRCCRPGALSCGCAVCRGVGEGGIIRAVVIRAIVRRVVVVVGIGLKSRCRQFLNSGFPFQVSHFAIERRFQFGLRATELRHRFPDRLAEFGQFLRTKQQERQDKDRDHFFGTQRPHVIEKASLFIVSQSRLSEANPGKCETEAPALTSVVAMQAFQWALPLFLIGSINVTAAGAEILKNIEFSRVEGVSLRLDASIPDGAGPFSAAIIVHGGGWVRGDRRIDVAPLFQPLTDAGIAWFSIDYRLASDPLRFGIAAYDVEAAIRFVREHAGEYRVDPERIALIGESAGGHLASLAALKGGAALGGGGGPFW